MRFYSQAAAVLALALTCAAQTQAGAAAPAGKTEKLWKIETSGIGG